MKYKKLLLGGLSIAVLLASFYFSWQGYVRIKTAEKYARELSSLQTAQSQTEQNIKNLLARQLGAEARKINTYYNSDQVTAVLLAVQSMKMQPSVEASQVLQYNLSAKETLRLGNNFPILSAAFSPDGKFVATGGADYFVRVWETSTGKEILRMRHNDAVMAVAFSPDGKQIVAAGKNKLLEIWNTADGEQTARIVHAGGENISIAFSPDGKYIALAGRTVQIWNVATGKEIARLEHEDYVTSIAFSPDSMWIVTGSADKTARVWDVTSGEEISRVTHKEAVTAVAFSPDGKTVISGSKDFTAQTWDPVIGEGVALTLNEGARGLVSVIKCMGPVTSVAFSPDGTSVAVGSEESKSDWMSSEIAPALNVWKVLPEKWEGYMTSLPLRVNVTSVAFSADGKYLLSSSEDNTARVWEIATGREISRMTHDDVITSIAFAPDSKQVLSSSLDHTARIWEVLSWQRITQRHHETPITSIAFSPDSKYIASSDKSGIIMVHETETGREVAHAQLEEPISYDKETDMLFYELSIINSVYSIAFSPDGKYIVSGGFDNTIRIWDSRTLREIRRISSPCKVIHPYADDKHKSYCSRGINSVAFSPDGVYVASGSVGGIIHVWKASTGQQVARMTIEEPTNPVNYSYSNNVLSVNFSPDGKLIVSGSHDNTIRIWDIATEQEVMQMKLDDKIMRHDQGGDNYFSPKANSVAFSPDGKFIVSGSEYNVVYLWDFPLGRELRRMESEKLLYLYSSIGKILVVAFSSDGKYIIAASDDNTVGIWDVSTGEEFSRIQNIYGYDKQVTFAAISPDGKYVASGDSRGDVNLWLWRPEDLIADACSRLPRNPTREEWEKYVGDYLPYQAVCPNLPIQ